MTALLVLLLLLSVATIASRPGTMADIVDRIALPMLILAGLGLGTRGLAVVSSSLTESLEPALAVGVTWLGILVGLRSSSMDAHGEPLNARAVIVVVASTVASVLLAGGAMSAPMLLGWRDPDRFALVAGAALIVGGALVSAPPVDRDNRAELALRTSLIDLGDIIAMACAVVALAVLPAWSAMSSVLAAVVVVGGGLLVALVQRLLGGEATGDGGSRMIALLGVVAVAAGLFHDAGLPSAVAGLVAGVVLGRTDLGRALANALLPTERPTRIVVTFLVGVMMPVSWSALLVGGLLAVGQLAVQLLATSWAVGHRPSMAALASGLSSSVTPLIVAASFALAGFPEGGMLVSSAAIAVVFADVVAVGLLLARRVRQPGTSWLPRPAS